MNNDQSPINEKLQIPSKNKKNPSKVLKREKIKKALMEKYDLSDEAADLCLTKIEKKVKNKKIEENNEQQSNIKSNNNSTSQDNNSIQQNKPKQQNVDTILTDIIPDYNKQVSIELSNVSLTFEVASEKVDTIKETFIRAIKREKPKKIIINALKNISFKIYKGEKVGIIGYNGAGKSTLLHIICGAYSPDTGEVKTYGNISPLLGLGSGFDPNYSGRKNIFFNGAVLGYDKEFLKEKEEEIIEFSELGEYIDMPIKNYSSGMLAKLGFSIATIVTPDILIIDEVLSVGDITFAKKSADKIKSLMDGGTTVLLVSHSIRTIRELCDKAIWINSGEIKEIGEVNKVCDKYMKDAEKATKEQTKNIEFN